MGEDIISQSGDTPGVLAVDLDGTLIASDLLLECFWLSMGQSPLPTASIGWSFLTRRHNRAGLKRALADLIAFDPSHLPYRQEVIAYITRWRDAGGRVVLVTASEQRLANRVAQHLGLFDAVYGSDGTRNLKGKTKAALLVELFGEGQFTYIGDAEADLPVWERAGRSITAAAPATLRQAAERLGHPAEHLAPSEPQTGPVAARTAPTSMAQEHADLCADAGQSRLCLACHLAEHRCGSGLQPSGLKRLSDE